MLVEKIVKKEERKKVIKPKSKGNGFADWEHPIFDGPTRVKREVVICTCETNAANCPLHQHIHKLNKENAGE